jgi:succinoglycan biosynthesis protein ExoW
MPQVAVVIPYFQREAGLLRRAVESIAAQRGVGSIDIIVADDASPVAPSVDLSNFASAHCNVRVVTQPNSGPGAARNLALDHVAPGTGFVAFLDSDDVWEPTHLRNAIDALGDEFDFYFSNHLEPDSDVDEFLRRNRLRLDEHERLPRGSNCFRFSADMVDQIIRGNVIETSTVVYRAERLGHLRFRRDFANAFEDHLFWLEAASQSRGIAFSSDVECKYGRGVSIWRSSGLGSDRNFLRLIDQRRFSREISARYARTPSQFAAVREHARTTRHEFVAEILHRLRRKLPIDKRLVARQLKLDPPLIVLALPIAMKILFRRMRK